MLRLRLLGGLSLESNDPSVSMPAGRTARSLLAWLVLHPGLHPRSAVAPRFWPDVVDGSARLNLRQTIFTIRRALGRHLAATRDEIGIVRAEGIWTDVWAFDDLIAEG